MKEEQENDKNNTMMSQTNIRPLPSYLVKRYLGWRSLEYEENRSWFQHLANMGQHPRAMVISCCDSRVHAMSLFGGESGEFFIHRNIANLIPPFNPNGDHHGTSAAIEYAVTVLGIAHLLVLGHSNCGGINSGFHVCNAEDNHSFKDTSFIHKWLNILKPAYEKLNKSGDEASQIRELEQLSIIVSLNNLMGFPFVKDAVDADRLTLHGLWHDIGSGELLAYSSDSSRFENV